MYGLRIFSQFKTLVTTIPPSRQATALTQVQPVLSRPESHTATDTLSVSQSPFSRGGGYRRQYAVIRIRCLSFRLFFFFFRFTHVVACASSFLFIAEQCLIAWMSHVLPFESVFLQTYVFISRGNAREWGCWVTLNLNLKKLSSREGEPSHIPASSI